MAGESGRKVTDVEVRENVVRKKAKVGSKGCSIVSDKTRDLQ